MINNVTSLDMEFKDQNIKFWSLYYTSNDMTVLLTSEMIFVLSRFITGISFKLIPLVELKLFNFVISAMLVCKIHRKQVAEKMTPSIIERYYWCKFQVDTFSRTKVIQP